MTSPEKANHNALSSEKSGDGDAHRYGAHFDETLGASEEERRRKYDVLTNQYYDLATRFYQIGWGRSFHFAPLQPGVPLKRSLLDYELRIAADLQLKSGMKVLDMGCGIGGPMMNLARETKADFVGLNNNEFQIETGKNLVRKAGLEKRCQWIKANFMEMPFPDGSFDAVYSTEAICHAPDRVALFREVFRILRPGGRFAFTDWCLTENFDRNDKSHQEFLNNLLIGNGLHTLSTPAAPTLAAGEAGFVTLKRRDWALDSHPDLPWYSPLSGSGGGWRSWVRGAIGQKILRGALHALEAFRIAPKGTVLAHEFLTLGADGLEGLGREEAFTPIFYFLLQKPHENAG